MKTRKYILFALAALLTASCMDDDWKAPDTEKGMESYGNQNIQETNVKTIAEIKTLFNNEITNNGLKQVKSAMQIKGVVVGNDQGGNIYNGIYIQDATGAIFISISQSGLYGPFTVGQCVLVDLEGLYVGGYGKLPQIGTTYTNPNTGNTSVGRMTRYMWQDHYKLLPAIEGLSAEPIVVRNMNALNIDKDCGKLVTLKGVEIVDANGTAVYAPNDGSVTLTSNCANRSLKGLNNVVIRTSTYADFANQVMPKGKVDITGIASRYNNTWQIMMRTENDIQPSTATDDDDNNEGDNNSSAGSGTLDDPYNVQGIINLTAALGASEESATSYYFKGYVTEIKEISAKYGNATFYISDSPEGGNSFYIYRCKGLGNANVTDEGFIKLGDEVVMYGKVANFQGNTPETVQGSAYVYSVNGKTN